MTTLNILHVRIMFSLLKSLVTGMILDLGEVSHDLEPKSPRGLNF